MLIRKFWLSQHLVSLPFLLDLVRAALSITIKAFLGKVINEFSGLFFTFHLLYITHAGQSG